MDDKVNMALVHMRMVIRDSILTSLEKASVPLSENISKWADQVPLNIMSDLSEAGWTFALRTGDAA